MSVFSGLAGGEARADAACLATGDTTLLGLCVSTAWLSHLSSPMDEKTGSESLPALSKLESCAARE